MDDMQLYEIDDILEYLPYLDRNGWEQCRLNTYFTSQIDHSKITIDKFLPLPWEEESNAARHRITKEEIEYMKQLEKLWSTPKK